MEKKTITPFLAGLLIGGIAGVVAVSAFKSKKYLHFPSDFAKSDGRMNTETGETWLLGQGKGGNLIWAKVEESK